VKTHHHLLLELAYAARAKASGEY